MSSNIWIEITKSEHNHGGKGWEFGTCLWSPSRNRTGSDRYSIMREPKVGDLVLHFYKDVWPDGRLETRIIGYSRVKAECRNVLEEPPLSGDWAGMKPYYRIDLIGYNQFTKPLPLSKLRETYGDEIRMEIMETHPRFYPFNTYGDTIHTVQGIYLARCTDHLYLLIKAIVDLEVVINDPDIKVASNAHSEYSEALRLSREKYFWARNPRLSNEAKTHYGLTCQVCGFNFGNAYGSLGSGYIECHHLNPLSERSKVEWTREVQTDLSQVRVVCSNCHRVIHRHRPAISMEKISLAIKKPAP